MEHLPKCILIDECDAVAHEPGRLDGVGHGQDVRVQAVDARVNHVHVGDVWHREV